MSTVDPVPQQTAVTESSSTGGGLAFIILTLNVLMFIVMCIGGVSLFQPTAYSVLKWGANYGPLTIGDHQWWRLLSSMFIHFGLIHLAVNMMVLINIGLFMEAVSGGPLFLFLYVAAGLGGGVASLLFHPAMVSAGASGAIFGLYGGLLAYLLRHRDSVESGSLSSLGKGALIFVGYNLVYGLFRPDIDLAAHFGGLATGFIVGLFL
jgi:rhomboid protease GluP